MRWVELFAGIGGARAALPPGHSVVQAIDHDEACHRVYTAAWGGHAQRLNLASVRARQLAEADAWWLSPPCQPYTVRGKRRDLDDPRAASLVHLLDLVADVRPRALAMENVPGFARSRAHRRVREVLEGAGYHVHERTLCPSTLGVPMRRPRWYLVADQRPLSVPVEPPMAPPRPLAEVLDPAPAADLWAPSELVERYRGRLAVVDPDEPGATAHVFTGAYGNSPVYAGSWLATPTGPRLFSPREILRLLGFGDAVRLEGLSRRKAYKLVGNSLSVDAVRQVLSPWAAGV